MKNNNSSIEKLFIPRGTFRPSDSLKDNIMAAARNEKPVFDKKSSKLKRAVIAAVSAAAALAVVVIGHPFIKQAYSMESYFSKASEYFTEVSSYVAEIDARTTPNENFAYIDADENFVRHTLTVQPSTGRWRLEKPGRVAMYDGTNTWLWLPHEQYGHQWIGNAQGVMEDFSILANPFLMLELEADYLHNNPKAKCKKTTDNDFVTIVIEAPANGEYENDYCRNTSLEDMDTYRQYVFEKETGRLHSLKIDALIKEERTTVFELKNIRYNVALNESSFVVPQNFNWKNSDTNFDSQDAAIKSFIGISPEKAVEMAFEALHEWDTTKLNVVLYQYNIEGLKETYDGCQLIGHKKAFHSGRYPGVFVPCKIRFKDQSIQKRNIAIRNDNNLKVWLIDGGI